MDSYIYIYMCVCVCTYVQISSSSSCRAACADIPDRLSPFLPIIHRLRQVFRITTRNELVIKDINLELV